MKIIGTGIDVVNIKRLEETLSRQPAVETKILTDAEIAYCRAKKNFLESIAGRFCAKEALYKALKREKDAIVWHDMEIISDGSHPVLDENCKLAKYMKETGLNCNISIAHEKDVAVAHAVVWSEK